MSKQASSPKSGINIITKFIILNLIGIFMFFVTVKIGDKETIPVDYVTGLIRGIPSFETVCGAIIVRCRR